MIPINLEDAKPGAKRWLGQDILWQGKAVPTWLFWDFVPPDDWSAIRAAIKWDSEPMLRIHAARLFLGCTTAHASNILIDAAARLYSIDHADIAKTDGAEIDLLFANVKAGTVAFDCLHLPCTLEEATVREIFGESAAYYVERLRQWKRLYAEATLRAMGAPA
jgi:hypothetical protein